MDDTTRPASTRPAPAGDVPIPVDGALPDRCQTRFWLSLTAAVFAVAGAVLAMAHAVAQDTPVRASKKDAPPLVFVSALAAMLALHLVMYAYRQGRIARILRGAVWHRSAHSVTTEGRGKNSRDLLHVESAGLWYVPSNYIGASAKLKRAHELEWSGDPNGRIVVRLPDGSRLELFRLEK